MKFAIVSGSHRPHSQSDKVANFLRERFQNLVPGSTATVVSLGGNPLPLWDEEVWQKTERWQKLWGPFAAPLHEADAFVFVVPEWGGMVPPGLKNMLLLCSTELAHKPALITSVTSGVGGSYPVSEMRMSGYKNTHINYLPSHLIVRHAEKVLNGDTVAVELGEDRLRERIDYSLKLLKVYAEGFQKIRATTELNLNQYPYGM